MSTIAVIKTGGKQYKVKEGQTLKVEKINGDQGEKVTFDTLLIADSESGEITSLGTPSLGNKVSAEIIETAKDDKVMVVKYKNKTRYKRTIGHRQPYTKVKINKIG